LLIYYYYTPWIDSGLITSNSFIYATSYVLLGFLKNKRNLLCLFPD